MAVTWNCRIGFPEGGIEGLFSYGLWVYCWLVSGFGHLHKFIHVFPTLWLYGSQLSAYYKYRVEYQENPVFGPPHQFGYVSLTYTSLSTLVHCLVRYTKCRFRDWLSSNISAFSHFHAKRYWGVLQNYLLNNSPIALRKLQCH